MKKTCVFCGTEVTEKAGIKFTGEYSGRNRTSYICMDCADRFINGANVRRVNK